MTEWHFSKISKVFLNIYLEWCIVRVFVLLFLSCNAELLTWVVDKHNFLNQQMVNPKKYGVIIYEEALLSRTASL